MKKSLIQKISEKGKKKIAIGLTAGILGAVSLSGCAGQNIRTTPMPENPYGNVKLTELGKQYKEKYGFDMFTYVAPMKSKSFKFYFPGKGMKVFYSGENIFIKVKNVSKITNTFEGNLNNLTTRENIKWKPEYHSLIGSLAWKDINMKFNATKLLNLGLEQGFHTTNWEMNLKACRNGKNAPCDSLGSIYFSVTDKKDRPTINNSSSSLENSNYNSYLNYKK